MGKFCPQCRGRGNVKTVVHYERIAQAFTDRGMFAPEIHDLANDHLKMAKFLSPKRTGRLSASHTRRVMPAVGVTRNYFIGTPVRYALFVGAGTAENGAGYIYPKTEPHLILRPQPYSYFGVDNPGRIQSRVKGQKAQGNWLAMAGSEALAMNGLGRSRFPNMVPKQRPR